jgi:Predicted membrane protein (DUF2231)
VISGLRAEDAIEHGEAIHEIMETHQRFGYITLGVFATLAIWRLLRETKMGRAERWAGAVAGIIGLGFVIATGREGGEMVYDHAAGIPTSALEAEIKNREAGHSHEGGEAHEHAAPADSMAPADSTSAHDTTAPAPTHTHAPGTPAHKD